MLCRDGMMSLSLFILSLVFGILPELSLRLGCNLINDYYTNALFEHIVQYGSLNVIVLLFLEGFQCQVLSFFCFVRFYEYLIYMYKLVHFILFLLFQVAVRSMFLGYVVGIAIVIFFTASPSWQMFGAYMAIIAMFHYTEFLAIAWTNPSTLSIDSFVLNHSISYGIAACSSWIEFIIERYYYPEMKMASSISYIGLILSISGEFLRKSAMFTAKHNFNHIVQSAKKRNHELITHGIYGIFRHPSYVGWFYWAIGTQVRRIMP